MKTLRNISCTIFKLIIHNVFENTSSHDSKSYILYLNHVTSYYSISPRHFPWIWIFTPLKCPTNQGLTMICFFHHFYELQSIIKKIWNSKELMSSITLLALLSCNVYVLAVDILGGQALWTIPIFPCQGWFTKVSARQKHLQIFLFPLQ